MRIRRDALDAVLHHARATWPDECCGILLAENGHEATVTRALRASNVESEHPERAYVVGHEAHLAAVELEAAGRACILGYYHSHPDGQSTPSRCDLDLAVGEVTYLIVGVTLGWVEYSAWRLEQGRLVTEPLEVS